MNLVIAFKLSRRLGLWTSTTHSLEIKRDRLASDSCPFVIFHTKMFRGQPRTFLGRYRTLNEAVEMAPEIVLREKIVA